MKDAVLRLGHPGQMTWAWPRVQEEGWPPERCPGKRWAFTGRRTGAGVVTGSAERSHRAGAAQSGRGLRCKYRGASNTAARDCPPCKQKTGPQIHAV